MSLHHLPLPHKQSTLSLTNVPQTTPTLRLKCNKKSCAYQLAFIFLPAPSSRKIINKSTTHTANPCLLARISLSPALEFHSSFHDSFSILARFSLSTGSFSPSIHWISKEKFLHELSGEQRRTEQRNQILWLGHTYLTRGRVAQIGTAGHMMRLHHLPPVESRLERGAHSSTMNLSLRPLHHHHHRHPMCSWGSRNDISVDCGHRPGHLQQPHCHTPPCSHLSQPHYKWIAQQTSNESVCGCRWASQGDCNNNNNNHTHTNRQLYMNILYTKRNGKPTN